MIGEKLSHYEIESEIGRGGMGIVYKAKDTKLNRTVAIKVLPIAMLGSDEDKARFFREAQAAAQVHHANIATVFAIEEAELADGTVQPFIAMEYIEGDTLTERISGGPMKLNDVVEISLQIASALEAAHEKDIVHRDVKSGNVMMTTKGSAKVLDFGLAKTAQSTKLTQLGSTLGTIAYMSPEQARGEEVDKRSDIWSLGVLIYEMISGRLPYASEYEQAAVYSILNEDPEPLTSLRTGVPMGLEWVVGKCLAKNADGRYQNVTDLIVDLKAIDLRSSTLSRASTMTTSVKGTRKEQPASSLDIRLIGLLALVAIVASGLTWLFTGQQTTNSNPDLRLPIEIHSEGYEGWVRGFDLSPDGTTLVYDRGTNLQGRLELLNVATGERTEIDGSELGHSPIIDPTGTHVAFVDRGSLYMVPVTGGFPTQLLESGSITWQPGYSWTPDGDLIYIPNWGDGIWRISSDGGEPKELVSPDLDAGEGGFSSPVMLPDGNTILAVRWGSGFNYEIVGIDVDSGQRTKIIDGAIQPRYLESGFLIYAQGDRLMASAFDDATLVAGPSVPVIDERLLTNYDFQRASFAMSASGVLVYEVGDSEWDQDIVRRPFNGESTIIADAPGAISNLELSPDGEKLAYGMFSPRTDSDVWVRWLDSNEARQFTSSLAYDGIMVWHPNSEYLYYSHQAGGPFQVHGVSIEEGSEPDTIDVPFPNVIPEAIHADGRMLVRPVTNSSDLVLVDVASDPPEVFDVAVTDENEFRGHISTDGQFVLYQVTTTQGNVIYARSLLPGSRRELVTDAGRTPLWSPQGDYAYFLRGRNLYRKPHSGDLQFGDEELVFSDVQDAYTILPDESGIITLSSSKAREVWVDFNFVDRLKETVLPLE